MSKLKPVIDKIENDFPEETYFRKNLKQRLDLEAVYVARKMKLGKDEDETQKPNKIQKSCTL